MDVFILYLQFLFLTEIVQFKIKQSTSYTKQISGFFFQIWKIDIHENKSIDNFPVIGKISFISIENEFIF